MGSAQRQGMAISLCIHTAHLQVRINQATLRKYYEYRLLEIVSKFLPTHAPQSLLQQPRERGDSAERCTYWHNHGTPIFDSFVVSDNL